MKIMKYILAMMCSCLIASCNSWLDVHPRTEIESGENYNTEQGYKDALTGAYLLMSSTSLYGKEMTYGFTDVLAQYYTGISGTSHSYYYASLYDYKNASNVSLIDAIWKNGYNVIANLNELIAHIDKADPTMFTGRNYHLIRGEAYGLRAFLHFDLLRLFGKLYAAGAGEKAIPYMTEVTTDVYPLLTTSQVLDKIQADLKTAEEELDVDPAKEGNVASGTDDVTYERNRTFKFNYYAVKMLQARAWLYAGNYEEANSAAQAVINQQTFTWTPSSEITSAVVTNRNYVCAEELVFCLYMSDLGTLYGNNFTSVNGLYMTEGGYEALFDVADYRYLYQTEQVNSQRVCAKLKQSTGGNANYLRRLPLMRISEAYYIAAECALHGGKLQEALAYLETVRKQRGLVDPYPSNLTADEVDNEIYKEYKREFFCEGQLFFYFKRKNRSQIPVYSKDWSGNLIATDVTPNYVLPLPNDELDYGGRTQNN